MEESFWTKKQSCKFSKVDTKKGRPFFDFVCFNGRHILKLRYLRRDSVEFQNFLFSVLSLTYIFIIYHALLCSNSQGYDHASGHLCKIESLFRDKPFSISFHDCRFLFNLRILL